MGGTHHCNAIVTKDLVQKKEDPIAFTIPCTISKYKFAKALCDLGASINLMSLVIFNKLGLGTPRPNTMRLLMVDRTMKRPVGFIYGVLVRVDRFIFPTDFVILDCEVDFEMPIILGRPFLAMGRALVDMERDDLKFRMNDEEVTFHICKTTKQPVDMSVVSVIDTINEVIESTMEHKHVGEMLPAVLMNYDGGNDEEFEETVNALIWLGSYRHNPKKLDINLENRASPPTKPSIIVPPILELKPLPSHLRYEFLGPKNTLPVIIFARLTDEQRERLMVILRKYKKAIGWCIADIQGIPPGIEHQRRLNPSMQEVVKTEIIKWLDVEVVYLIANSSWCIEIFMDDFFVVGDSFDECLGNLSHVLKRCETNLILNWEKYHFMAREGIVLGHKISERGLEVDQAKIEVIVKLPLPISVKGVRSFLRHAGFYRRFIKDFSKIANHLCKLLENESKFVFDDASLKAFECLKEQLTSAPIIIALDWSKPFELMCDASGVSMGAVLCQKREKIFHPIYYASKTLNGAQMNYTVTEQELLAIVFAFEKF
ncbi:uncharacterized protein LOC132639533 [Lycium barbarum]|uniref:uncharacterized protein LOC132639533 n=1 Tax=Lycium barbarum TaxID=112863 RepID=UPI00293EF16C|nr:uncharacterized protein LOC132639533 [Lycium barbarum]